MAKILVTGGAGFVGSHLVDKLVSKGHKVVIIDNLSTGRQENLNTKAKFLKLDIRSKKVADVFKKEKFDYVIHLAAQINVRNSVQDPLFDAQVNILGSLNLLENSKNYKISKFIFASSGGVIYGETKQRPTLETHPEQPLSPYGVSKWCLEKYLYYYGQTYGLPYTVLRYANVYGPRQNPEGEAGVVAIFLSKLLKGLTPVINGDGKQTRDYIYVADVAEATALAIKNKVGIFNVGTGRETNVIDLFRKIICLGDFKALKKYGPAPKGELIRSSLDNYKIKRNWGFVPKYSLDQGLEETIDYFREKIG